MTAIFYRVVYAVAEFCRRAPIDRNTYRVLPDGTPRVIPSGEVRIIL